MSCGERCDSDRNLVLPGSRKSQKGYEECSMSTRRPSKGSAMIYEAQPGSAGVLRGSGPEFIPPTRTGSPLRPFNSFALSRDVQSDKPSVRGTPRSREKEIALEVSRGPQLCMTMTIRLDPPLILFLTTKERIASLCNGL
jgi:hypothetical protein